MHSVVIIQSSPFGIHHLVGFASLQLNNLCFLWSLQIFIEIVTSMVLRSEVFVTISLTLLRLIKLLFVQFNENPLSLQVSFPVLVLYA